MSDRRLLLPSLILVAAGAGWLGGQFSTQPGSPLADVLVAPARKVWQITRDAAGREIGCWVRVPARYELRHSTVLVRPQRTWLETLPPRYGMVPRQVTVRPSHVVHQVIPAVTRTETRTVVVQPGRDEWRPLAGHPRPHHHRHPMRRHGH